jgi:hypothetical protein
MYVRVFACYYAILWAIDMSVCISIQSFDEEVIQQFMSVFCYSSNRSFNKHADLCQELEAYLCVYVYVYV